MKQILLFCFVLGFTTNSQAQYADTTKHTLATDYLKKSKNQKKVAWIMLGGGATFVLTSFIIQRGELEGFTGSFGGFRTEEYKNDGIKGAFGLSGTISMLGSIPVFIAAGKNKRRAAASVSFKMENATNIYQWAVTNTRYPAVAIQIRL